MRVGILFLLLMSFSILHAAEDEIDLENGKKLHKRCALCHGQWSQGIKGGLYPRLAGMNEEYLVKQFKDYQKAVRQDSYSTSMIVIGGLRTMSEKDMNDLAAYISDIDLKEQSPLDIPLAQGDVKKGKKLYKGDCKTCHGRKGEGKSNKGTPLIAGQYTEYLMTQIKFFMKKQRYHDNDPDDETFKAYTPEELQAIMAYLSTLDD